MCHWQWNAPQVFFLFQVHSPRHEIWTNHSTTMIFIFTYFIEAMHYMYIYNTHTHTRTCLQDVYILYTYITILLIFLLLLSISSLCGLSKLVLVHLRFCPRSKGHTLSDSRKLTPKSIVKWGMESTRCTIFAAEHVVLDHFGFQRDIWFGSAHPDLQHHQPKTGW